MLLLFVYFLAFRLIFHVSILPMETQSLFMASKQVLEREWELTPAFQKCQSETKHLVYISLEIMFLWQIFPLCDNSDVGIVSIVFACSGILY